MFMLILEGSQFQACIYTGSLITLNNLQVVPLRFETLTLPFNRKTLHTLKWFHLLLYHFDFKYKQFISCAIANYFPEGFESFLGICCTWWLMVSGWNSWTYIETTRFSVPQAQLQFFTMRSVLPPWFHVFWLCDLSVWYFMLLRSETAYVGFIQHTTWTCSYRISVWAYWSCFQLLRWKQLSL